MNFYMLYNVHHYIICNMHITLLGYEWRCMEESVQIMSLTVNFCRFRDESPHVFLFSKDAMTV